MESARTDGAARPGSGLVFLDLWSVYSSHIFLHGELTDGTHGFHPLVKYLPACAGQQAGRLVFAGVGRETMLDPRTVWLAYSEDRYQANEMVRQAERSVYPLLTRNTGRAATEGSAALAPAAVAPA